MIVSIFSLCSFLGNFFEMKWNLPDANTATSSPPCVSACVGNNPGNTEFATEINKKKSYHLICFFFSQQKPIYEFITKFCSS